MIGNCADPSRGPDRRMTMADSSKNPFMDMFQDFGKSMSIPSPDINSMMEYHRKNLQALQAAAQVGSSSAQTLMGKQREALAYRNQSTIPCCSKVP